MLLSLICMNVGRADDALMQPPAYVGPPVSETHAVTNRAFQGIPSLAVAPGGRQWANWYAGITPGEDHNNYVVLSTSADGGATWKEVLIVDPDGSGPVRAYDPELWMAPDGKLFVFWAQAVGHGGSIAGVWCVSTTDPDSENPTWSKPQRLTDGIMMCKPVVLSTGEWVLPASTWRKTDQSARMIVSTDQGKTWGLRGACNVPVKDREFDEHMFIERGDGSLWLLVRTKYGIGESVSTDRGKTWPELTPSEIPHPSARFFIRPLASGNLLLVKHGPIDKRTGRSHLTAFVSSDEGKSWQGGLLLDERGGVSYPDGQQTADGLIHIVYDFSRTDARHILTAQFREEDVLAGRDVSGEVRLRNLVSAGSGGRVKQAVPVRVNPDGVPLSKTKAGQFVSEKFSAQPLVGGVDLFTDRSYTAAELVVGLPGVSFLRVPLEGTKSIVCKRPGTVWFLTPKLDRNKDSQTANLLEQGFKEVSHPEVRLFDPKSTGNYCSLYQKDCKVGETITIHQWAVPIFLQQ